MPRDLTYEASNEGTNEAPDLAQPGVTPKTSDETKEGSSTPFGAHISLSPEAIDSERVSEGTTGFQSSGTTDLSREAKRDSLNMLVQTLNPSHVDSCTVLEEHCFPPNERCSKEKFQYRLSQCGCLHLGLFSIGLEQAIHDPESHSDSMSPHEPRLELFNDAPTAATTPTIQSLGLPARKEILLGHIVCTLSKNLCIKDSDMQIPDIWKNNSAETGGKTVAGIPGETEQPAPQATAVMGHNPLGRTLCLHSLAILPALQGNGLSRILMTSFIQRFKDAGVADRIALLAHDELVPFYEKLGFKHSGKSEATFGGSSWNDMIYTFPPLIRPPIPTLVPNYDE